MSRLPGLWGKGRLTARGLPWVRISTEIAMDGEIELVSDAAFRTYVEIIALSGHYLLDGRVPLRLVRKQCNAADIDGALRELSSGEHPYLMIDDGNVVIPKYYKWQETADQVGKRREATLQRVRKHRAIGDDRNGVTETDTDAGGNGVTSVQSTEYRVESREEEKTILSDETPDRPTQKSSRTALIRARFEHWKATFPEETLRMSLTDDRKRAISGRLREGHSAGDHRPGGDQRPGRSLVERSPRRRVEGRHQDHLRQRLDGREPGRPNQEGRDQPR